MAVSEQLQPANRYVLYYINAAAKLFSLADANVNPMTAWAGSATTTMEGYIRSKTVHENLVPLQRQIADQLAQVHNLGIITNTALGTADTVAALRNILVANGADSTIGSTYPCLPLML